MKRLTRLWGAYGRRLLLMVVPVILVMALLLYKLGSLSHGLNAAETDQQLFSASWHHWWANPLYLPLHLVQWIILTLVSHHGATVTRLGNVIFGLATWLTIVFVLRRWYGLKTMLYSGVLIATSAWFLHVSRYASVDVLYLWTIPTLLAMMLLWEAESALFAVRLLLAGLLAIVLYVPGSLWLAVVVVGLQFGSLRDGWRTVSKLYQRVLLIMTPLLLIIPLLHAFVVKPALFSRWLGVPAQLDTPLHMVTRLGLSISYLVFRGPVAPALWLDRQPVVGIFGLVAGVLGVVFYLRHLKAGRTRLLIALFVVSALLFALNGLVAYGLIVSLAYLVIAAGIGYLLHEWLKTFPRNVLARSVGYSVLGIVIAIAAVYNLRSYFVAWPHNPASHAAFQQR